MERFILVMEVRALNLKLNIMDALSVSTLEWRFLRMGDESFVNPGCIVEEVRLNASNGT